MTNVWTDGFLETYTQGGRSSRNYIDERVVIFFFFFLRLNGDEQTLVSHMFLSHTRSNVNRYAHDHLAVCRLWLVLLSSASCVAVNGVLHWGRGA